MGTGQTNRESGRVIALDGLRGLAAIMVVIGHTIGALRTPPGIAAPSVMLFFVLSGYCLSASALRGDHAVDRAQFFLRRIFRIHPPFVFALLIAWGVSLSSHTAPCCDGLSSWILNFNFVTLTPGQLAGYLFFPGTAGNLMPVGWTLEVEMVFSLLVPFLLWLARGGHWLLPLGLALVALLQASPAYHGQLYAIHFVAGILIHEGASVSSAIARRAPVALSLVVIVATVYFTAIGLRQIPSAWNVLAWIDAPRSAPVTLLAIALSSSALTVGAVHLPWLRRALEWRPVRFLGRVSYSVYLLHFTVLLLFVRRVEERQTSGELLFMIVAVVGVTVALAALAYRYVELPSIRLGNALCTRLAQWTHGVEHLSRIPEQRG
ncbi:MAG: acyltransferase [bacterium]|nr:acyltransferase [bacterium]